eukprot:7609722-Alexandrium_andersonii.AAC.1
MGQAPEPSADPPAAVVAQKHTPKTPGRQQPNISPERLKALMAEHPGKAPECFHEVERRDGRKLIPRGA